MKKFLTNLGTTKIIEYALLIAGCLVISLSFNLFLCPNKIASGGIPGLSVVLNKLLGINTAYIQWGINMPLFFIGVMIHGKGFGLKTAIGSFFIPMFVLLTQNFPIFSHNLLIAASLGGIGVGIGLGLVFASKGSVGGFSLIARLLHDYTNVKLSSLIVILNTTVILLAGFTFGFSGALYALMSLVLTGLSIDAVHYASNLFKKV